MENSFNSLKKLGDDNYQQTNYEEAVKYYTQAIETDDDNIYLVYLNRCLTYIKMNKYTEALDDAIKSTILKQDNAKAWGRVGSCLLALKKDKQATLAFNKAYQLEPTNEEYKKLSNNKNSYVLPNMEGLMGNLFNKMMNNKKLIKLALDQNVQGKLENYKSNPLLAMENPAIRDLIKDVFNELK